MKPCPCCSDEKASKSIRLVDLTTEPRLILHCDNCQHEWPFPALSRTRTAHGRQGHADSSLH
jgi:hypothetical protein